MGTNYYWHPFVWGSPVHIGKSSAGWCFALHVVPDKGIKCLDDWKHKLNGFGIIRDEYGRRISKKALLDNICNRSWQASKLISEEFLLQNYAVDGPHGLLRAKIDGARCIGHGEGTYDYIIGEFS